jgi:transposase
MTAPYSMDLRERALARKGRGGTHRDIASALRISPSCVSKWTKRVGETGSVAPGQVGGHKSRTLSGEWAAWLRDRIASGPFTLRGAEGRTGRARDQDQSSSGLGVRSRRRTELQKHCCLRSRAGLMSRRRARWKAHQGRIDSSRLVFLDDPNGGAQQSDLDQDQHGAPARLGAQGATPEGPFALRSLEDPDLHRRPTRRT